MHFNGKISGGAYAIGGTPVAVLGHVTGATTSPRSRGIESQPERGTTVSVTLPPGRTLERQAVV